MKITPAASTFLKPLLLEIVDSAKRMAAVLLLVSLGSALAACGGGDSTTPDYSVGGIVNGLQTGNSLVLQNNGTNNITQSANGTFTIADQLPSGTSYAVTVLTQPAGQTCTVTNGSGQLAGDVSNVMVNCSAIAASFTVSGTVAGLLSGRSVALQDNGGNTTTVPADGSFAFTTPVAGGASYAVTVLTQPAGQNCAITHGSGTVAGAGVNNISVICSDDTYNIDAAVSGLAMNASVVLQLNAGDNLNVSANGTSNFNAPIASGSTYAVTVLTQPAGESCAVSNGSGTVEAANVSVPVVCTPMVYTVGGAVSGLLTGRSVVLQDNGSNTTTVSVNGSFVFSTSIANGSAYAVTVLTQPSGQICSVTQGSGTVAGAGVGSVAVSCTSSSYAVGGTLTGLNGTVVLQDNGGDNLTLTTNGSFTFVTSVAGGAAYAVSVLTQPSGQNCAVSGGSGTVGSTNVSNVTVACAAAAGNWIWQGGPDTPNAAGVYGTQGTPAAGNIPSSRYLSSTWTDAAGNFWLFGGYSGTPGGNIAYANDLWMYSPASGEWTWKSGSSALNAVSVFGTQGVAAAANVPAARNSAATWIDGNGNLWLFGGYGCIPGGSSSACENGYLNDLWKYTPSTGYWTWVGGSQGDYADGVYGTQGQAAAGNIPGARFGSSAWVDASGNLWLFGGQATDSTGNFGTLNDLWKYAPSTNQWTWVGGSKTYNGAIYSVFGTQGTAAAGNWPGANDQAATWVDASGNFWLFGGYEFVSHSSGAGLTNDLWKYSPGTGEWTWVSGTATPGQLGVYGTQGTAASGNFPGGRWDVAGWVDSAGNFWIYGGNGYSTVAYGFGNLGDLWKFSPSSGLWTWMSGPVATDGPGSYGTLGTAAAGNQPGARQNMASWIDTSGNLWLFGGGGGYNSSEGIAADVLNDLWEYTP
jgi:hypothetical protein